MLTLSAAALLTGCDRAASRMPPSAPSLAQSSAAVGFTTSESPQALSVSPGAVIQPIITVGDRLPGGFVFDPIPDGLGAHVEGHDLVVYANHELAAAGVPDLSGSPQFRFARVSRLVIDPATLAVKDATYVLNGAGAVPAVVLGDVGRRRGGLPVGLLPHRRGVGRWSARRDPAGHRDGRPAPRPSRHLSCKRP